MGTASEDSMGYKVGCMQKKLSSASTRAGVGKGREAQDSSARNKSHKNVTKVAENSESEAKPKFHP